MKLFTLIKFIVFIIYLFDRSKAETYYMKV